MRTRLLLAAALICVVAGARLLAQDGSCPNCNPAGGNCNSGNCNSGNGAKHPVANHIANHFQNKHHCNGNAAAQRRASKMPWHGYYYYPQWGGPVALVVPPTAEFQTHYSWGVPSTRNTPIDHQFTRNFSGYGPDVVGQNGFLPPPKYPNDTDQAGVYYVRGPW